MNKYLRQLTWLRGIAAFVVVCSHILRAIDPVHTGELSLSNESWFRLLDLGTFGVLLFFVLSGCTLAVSNSFSFSSRFHIYSFFVKRFFRIWPAYLFAIFVYSLFRIIFQNYYGEIRGDWIENQFLSPISTSDFMSYLTLTFNFFGQSGLFNNAFWSLPIEFQYYLIFPLLIVSLRVAGFLGPIVIGGLLYVLPKFVNLSATIDPKLFFLAYSFCGGVLLGYIYLKIRNKININQYLALISIFVILLVNGLVTNYYISLPNVIFLSNFWNFYTLSAFLITSILLFSHIRLPHKLDELLTLFGEVSYSTYLIHNLVIGCVMLVIINNNLYVYEHWLVPAFVLFFTYLIAIKMYRYIEIPGIKIGRKVAKKFPIN